MFHLLSMVLPSRKKNDLSRANKFIGGGTAGLFLVAMPLFLFKESKGKDMKDYMLTKENIKKMQGPKKEKTLKINNFIKI